VLTWSAWWQGVNDYVRGILTDEKTGKSGYWQSPVKTGLTGDCRQGRRQGWLPGGRHGWLGPVCDHHPYGVPQSANVCHLLTIMTILIRRLTGVWRCLQADGLQAQLQAAEGASRLQGRVSR